MNVKDNISACYCNQ